MIIHIFLLHKLLDKEMWFHKNNGHNLIYLINVSKIIYLQWKTPKFSSLDYHIWTFTTTKSYKCCDYIDILLYLNVFIFFIFKMYLIHKLQVLPNSLQTVESYKQNQLCNHFKSNQPIRT